ncbi:MAG: oxidoreductase [Isosphaeraceae bacterium]|jgi:predicted dehydrogenase|nr:MAG: oxidoreductase [Isosphaeraceae bacterium]
MNGEMVSRLVGVLVVCLSWRAAVGEEPIRVGIIGCDTSHAVAFTEILHDPKAEGERAGFRVVVAYPGGSEDIASSRERVGGYVQTLREKHGVEIVESIKEVLAKCDVVLLESVDGRPHRAQAEPVLRARKPVFIDKPVAGSLADAVAIYELAEATGTPCFTSSALRFEPGIVELRDRVGEVVGCDTYGPCELEPHHPDLFWYGVHGVEALYAVMGMGCETVVRAHTEGTDVVVGTWGDGRIGTFRGIRAGRADFGATVFGTKGIGRAEGFTGYGPLVLEICRFFRTGRAPVSAAETLEMFAVMEAADESRRRGGVPVKVRDVLEAARVEARR